MPRLLHHISVRYRYQISSSDFPVQSSKIALFGAQSRL